MKQPVKKVLLLGSGALKIGEAGEFDYSGTQALKALREEGIFTILINPNIATVQTSEGMADKIYFLPVTPFFVEKVIEKEQPEGILLSFGGQTALNCGIALFQSGVLEKHNVRVLGTPVRAILDTEDRELFTQKLDEINVKTPRSLAVTSIDEAVKAAASLGYPVIVRSAFSLGGLGSGFCSSEEEMRALTQKSFSYSSQVLVEESLKGWKEVEYEVVRDGYDNCITVCNMENFDPLGIHTGESIVVAPSQTLTNREYHKLRELSIRIIRHIGIVGECNVQYALDPDSEDYRVIEVNARLSRSSALASKATGYPLAFVAAKLSLGYGLFELKNSVTKDTSAFFEPALDYIVVKIPRWDLGKFQGVSREIGSSMKSVGEVMAIGRSFEEAIQKGLRMIGQGMHGFVGNKDIEDIIIDKELSVPTDMRIFVIAMALLKGYSIDRIFELTKIDRWFLSKLKNIFDMRTEFLQFNTLEEIPDRLFLKSKQQGFSDFQIARFVFKSDRDHISDDLLKVRNYRKSKGIVPFVKQIDTMAAEYPARTNYLYLTYNGSEHDISFSEKRVTAPTTKAVGSEDVLKMEPTALVVGRKKQPEPTALVVGAQPPSRPSPTRGKEIMQEAVGLQKEEPTVAVLGSGAYRIGSSVEFDWCGVNALDTINKEGYRSIMINYNPETVSTDYDVCDRLYFEELTFERVMDILDLENPLGVIVSTGGQIPNNLAMRLFEQDVNILGTSPLSIDKAENRHKFSAILDELEIDQPRWIESSTVNDVFKFTEEVGFPVIVRPSYVLSGAAMNIVSNSTELGHFLEMAAEVSKQYPVVVSKFIEDSKEVEMDAVARDGEIICYAISEHVEFAGVHSGDATMLFPPQKIYVETVRRIKRISRQIAEHLNISGPFNIQFLAKDNDVMVIECNLRASRSFPFISKVLKTNFIEIATRIMLGKPVTKPDKSLFDLDYVGVKASQFSFSRLQKADPVLGVEMVSTGEVGCIGDNYYEAILKSMLSVGYTIPHKAILFSSGPSRSKIELLNSARMLQEKGLAIYATGGTHDFFTENGVRSTMLHWPGDGKAPNTIDYLKQKKIDLVINIPKNLSSSELDNDYRIRRSAVDFNIPLITNARLASAFIYSICKIDIEEIGIKSWDEYE